MVACEHQQVKVAEMLLQAKADPNILDNIGRSCLHTVAAARNANLISLLCSHDANPHSCENDTRIPPLTVAALFGDLASVKALMEFGANPNYPKNSLLAPIIAAAQEGQINIVKFLLERGADPSVGNPYGYSALHFAALRKHYDVVKCILSEDPSPDILTEDKATPLMCAAAGGSEEIVKLLIDSGAQVDAVRTVKMASGKVQVSPVAEAALSSHFGVVRVLIENNAYLHHLSGGVHSVLEFACAGGDPEIVQLIVSKFDSDVDLSEYEVPIIRAVADGNFECAKAIVDNIGLQTLLDKATSTGKQQFADALCRYGDVLKDHQMVLPNVGRKMSRTVGTSEDIFLQFRYQQMSVQIQVDCIKYAVLFHPLLVVREERKLYVDVCWHLLHHFENKEELYTNALECGYVDVVAFLEDYSDKAVVTEAESSAFLRRIQSGDPTPVQFLCSATTVDSLWDTAESTNKDSVAQFFTEVQARSQKSGCSAFLNIKRVFNESMMTAILEKLKKSVQENYEEPILCCLSYGESHGPNEWSESVLDEIPDSASMLHCYELVQSNKTPDEPEASRRIPSCQDDLSQEHMRNNETLVTQPSSSAITSVTYSANSVTSFVSDNSSCEMTSSKGTNDGPIPPPNTTVYGKAFEQSQHPPLEKALNKLRELDKGMQLNQPIYSFENHRKVLTKVAAKVGTKWSFLARYFGMEEDTIKTFKTRSSNIGERSCQMLRFWIKENVETATWGVLCDNLVRILRGDIADVISQYLFGNRDHSILQYAGKNVGSNIDILMFVANQVGSYWERLATELGVTVRQTATCDEDLCITVLCEWINASHQPRLYCQLYDALENIELGDSIALIEEELQAS
jgi:ankyrin repeat protein